jgi:C-terminal processing protease CtpA/Prc
MRTKTLRYIVMLLLKLSAAAWSPQRPISSPARTKRVAAALVEQAQFSPLEGAMRTIAAATIACTLILGSLPAFALDEDPTLFPAAKRYWSIMGDGGTVEERVMANEALIDHAVGTINTMYYDSSGGYKFAPRDMFTRWRHLRDASRSNTPSKDVPFVSLTSREETVQGLKWLVSTLEDPFSKYLTRDELKQEFRGGKDGFLGLGAMVEPPQVSTYSPQKSIPNKQSHSALLSTIRVENLPVVTAVAPNSPAERAGVTVGDRVVAVGSYKFRGLTRGEVTRALQKRFSAENYAGQAEVTLAKPVFNTKEGREVVTGYRLSRLKLLTTSNEPFTEVRAQSGLSGDSIVQYKLLTPTDSILDQSSSKVGYIRLTRFSHTSTKGFFKAIHELEAAGAQSYIIDLRNNYGGIIQEAMLTASTLLRDPHSVLCYTMNSRGGFTPHDVEEYIVDTRYPGYLLSSEPSTITVNQVRRENPEMFDGVGVPPSSFASLHEQSVKRGIHRDAKQWNAGWSSGGGYQQFGKQKKIVVLINEGTASSAEVFASALHDNGRTVALVGTKTYGKGLIQHTFPMPDGGGLRLTVAEYLTPSLHHVTKVGSAKYDRETGDWVGGGIRPDIICESKQGIPQNVGADFCVGTAIDALEEAELNEAYHAALDPSTRPLLLFLIDAGRFFKGPD